MNPAGIATATPLPVVDLEGPEFHCDYCNRTRSVRQRELISGDGLAMCATCFDEFVAILKD